MAPRSSWKGFLKLSLISVPIKAFTANNTSEDVRLNQLHAECHNRVKYQKVCPEHGEIKADQIVSGYEYAKDQYVIIDPKELARLRPEFDRSVRIDGFVRTNQVDSIYFAGKSYYLLPDGIAGLKAYGLLEKGMADADVCGVAHVVIAGREQLVLLRSIDGVLALTVLNVARKVKSVDEFKDELPEQEMTKEELALTKTLIEASLIDDFDFKSYKDVYVDRLSELIKMKIDGQEIVEAPHAEEPKILNLMEALKKSVAEAQVSSGKKMAGSVKSTAARKKTRKKKSG